MEESAFDRWSHCRGCDAVGVVAVLSRYCRAIDDRDFDLLASVFAPDATLVLADDRIQGREAVVESVRTNLWPPGIHQTFNHEIAVDDEQAVSRSSWLWLDEQLAPRQAGRYVDELVRTRDEWLIRVRRVEVTTLEPRPDQT